MEFLEIVSFLFIGILVLWVGYDIYKAIQD
jgi:hypothetical protein